jgi:hypothetical protein
MDPSLWNHVIAHPGVDLAAGVSPLEAFLLGVAASGVVVAGAACSGGAPRAGSGAAGRRALVTGWVDLFRLVGAVARVGLLLMVGLLLLGRVLFWPAGRRW